MSLRLLFPRSLGAMKAEARADLVAQTLSRRLGTEVEVEVAPTYEDLGQRMQRGEVDVAWAPPALCARAEPRARAILESVREQGSTFFAAMVCRSGAGLSLLGLSGQRAAWVDPLSTSGYLLPRARMREEGFDPDGSLGAQRFWGSFRDAAMAVVERRADLCSVFAHERAEPAARKSLQDLLGGLAYKLEPFAYAGPSPSDGLVITRRLDADVAEALIELLTAEHTPTVLHEVCNVVRFERARWGAYSALRSQPPAAHP